jgi:hypothetical protein
LSHKILPTLINTKFTIPKTEKTKAKNGSFLFYQKSTISKIFLDMLFVMIQNLIIAKIDNSNNSNNCCLFVETGREGPENDKKINFFPYGRKLAIFYVDGIKGISVTIS